MHEGFSRRGGSVPTCPHRPSTGEHITVPPGPCIRSHHGWPLGVVVDLFSLTYASILKQFYRITWTGDILRREGRTCGPIDGPI